jgi:uncharacterized protein YcfJ
VLRTFSKRRVSTGQCEEEIEMKHYILLGRWQKLVAVTVFATLGFVLPATTAFAASSSFCQAYARDYSLRYSSGGAMGGIVRGALGGAAIGGIVNGGRGARRGAGAGALAGGVSRGIQRSTLYDRAYLRCMRGRWP